MEEKVLQFSFDEYDSLEELKSDDRFLLEKAWVAVDSAYAPYSQYKVGAAVLLDNGMVICGSNQENAAYPSGLCAERVAVFAASSQYPNIPIKAVAITAKAKNYKINFPVPPCGACRQVMVEYQNLQKGNIRLILKGETGKIHIIEGIDKILPFKFHTDELKL